MQESDIEVLLDLLLAVDLFAQAKAAPKNPFVRSFKGFRTEKEAEDLMLNALGRAEHLLPLAEARIEQLDKELMAEIEAEEKSFDGN